MRIAVPTPHQPGTLAGCPENSLENILLDFILQHGDAFGCIKLRAQGDEEENRVVVDSIGQWLSAIPNITMRSPSFCIGPCPAQIFCICKSLALFPFSFTVSSSLTAGLKETQNSRNEYCAYVQRGLNVRGCDEVMHPVNRTSGKLTHLSNSSKSSRTVIADTMVMVYGRQSCCLLNANIFA